MTGWFREYVSKRLTRSSRWPKVRKDLVVEVGECEACGSKKRLEGHHIKPFALFPWLELVRSNLICLCFR